MSKPSDFAKVFPCNSVAKSSEAETIARNIIMILKRTGDNFRDLSWDEYTDERVRDGDFTKREAEYFLQVINYCTDEKCARLFSPEWKKV